MKLLESKVVFMAHDFWLKTLTGCWNSADSVPWTFALISFYTPRVGTCPRDLNVHGQGPLPLTYDRSNYRSGASKTFPLVSWQNTVSISLLVTRILLLFVFGGTTPWRGDQKCGACTQHMSDQIGFIISFNCTVQKETLVVHTVSLHHRVLYHHTNTTHPRLSLPLFFLELSSQQQLCPYTVMPLWRGHQLQCVLAEMGNWWSGECSFVLDLQWTGANRNNRNDYSNSL